MVPTVFTVTVTEGYHERSNNLLDGGIRLRDPMEG